MALEDEWFETLDDLRSGLLDLSRVEEPEDLSLVDSFLPESPEFRWGSLRRFTARPESPFRVGSRRVSILRCDFGNWAPVVSRARRVPLD